MIANWELTDQKNFKELLEEVVFVGRLKLFLDKSRRECFCFVCQYGHQFSPFYWSARDLAADMFSMERDQKKETGQIQHN